MSGRLKPPPDAPKERCARCGSERSVKLTRDRLNDTKLMLCGFCRKRLAKFGYELVVDVQ